MGDVQNDFDRLNSVAQQQHSPQQHHGLGAGTIVSAGVIAALVARNAHQRRQVGLGLRPKNLKDDWVLGWYLMAAVALHVLSAVVVSGPLTFWLVAGPLIWIPAWILGIRHHLKNRAINREIWDRFNQRQASTQAPPIQPSSFLDQWREDLRRDSGN
jgi:hypothetical protein